MTTPSSDVRPSGGWAEHPDRPDEAREPEAHDDDTDRADEVADPDEAGRAEARSAVDERDIDERDIDERDIDERAERGRRAVSAAAPASPGASPAGVVRRPPEMLLGAAFLTVAALPSIVIGGALAALVGRLGAALREEVVAAAGGADPDAVLLAARAAGALALVLGVAFITLAWLAIRPRRWARTVVAALAAMEMVLLVLGMVATAPDPVSIGLTLLAGAGVALVYLPRSEEFLLSQG